MSIHHFDLMRLILGRDAVSVYAKVTDPAWSKFEQEGAAAITVEFEGGLVVSYRGSWISPGKQTHWAGEWNLECESANLYFTSREGGDAGTTGDLVSVTDLKGKEKDVALRRRSTGAVRRGWSPSRRRLPPARNRKPRRGGTLAAWP